LGQQAIINKKDVVLISAHERLEVYQDLSGSLSISCLYRILDFRDKAFNTYFKSPMYLKMIQDKFGQSVVDHINEMVSYNLPRAHHKSNGI
jgi:hypothetical protein